MISADELALLAAIEHPDPHRVLGPHVEEDPAAVVIRAFRPEALEITLRPDNEEQAAPQRMQKIHDTGVFEARFPGAARAFSYRLEIRYSSATYLLRDAYAFPPGLGDLDLHLAAEGKHLSIYRRLGAHVREINGVRGTAFAVWAPFARRVSVAGDFNSWDGRLHAMRRMGHGIWEIFIPDVAEGALYKFEVLTMHGLPILKSDPYGQAMELRPRTASRVVRRSFEFSDAAWIAAREKGNHLRKPMAIYEVHLGSWRIRPKEPDQTEPRPPSERRAQAEPRPEASEPDAPESKGDPAERWLSYRELAAELVDYVADMGFTHIELLPVMEHPYDGSWGYQVSGYFAPTSRYGEPDDLRYFIDRCHARGIGVILDWTPAHFPKDAFALGRFDGSALYEHIDPRQGEHKQWQTYIFNYGRNEVRNFLLSNALYWIDEFHVDGLRVDAVASMLYLDYGASHAGEWVANKYGGRENLDAVSFLRELCDTVHKTFPGTLLAAEESTAWPSVTGPTYLGGLGFDFKWNMGWMHDNLNYFSSDPIFRSFQHGKITFGMWYAYAERFILPLSHDEVVHLKKSLISKMPGDRWQMHANVRSLYAHMWAHPGKKLLFMGAELGQYREWNFEGELDWWLLKEPDHAGLQRLIRDLNMLYRKYPALHELDDQPEGFHWIDANDSLQSVASYVRFPLSPSGNVEKPYAKKGVHVISIGNFTPVPRVGYRIGVPRHCRYLEVLNTNAAEYGGSGMGNLGMVACEDVQSHGFAQSVVLSLPPLAVLWLVPELEDDAVAEPFPAKASVAVMAMSGADVFDEETVITTKRSR